MTKRQLIQELASYGDNDPVLIEHSNQQWEVQTVHAAARSGSSSETGAKGGEATSQGRMIALQAGQQYRPASSTPSQGSPSQGSPSQK